MSFACVFCPNKCLARIRCSDTHFNNLLSSVKCPLRSPTSSSINPRWDRVSRGLEILLTDFVLILQLSVSQLAWSKASPGVWNKNTDFQDFLLQILISRSRKKPGESTPALPKSGLYQNNREGSLHHRLLGSAPQVAASGVLERCPGDAAHMLW